MVAAIAVLWGTIGVVVREIDLPAAAIVAGRVWVAALGLGAWMVLRPRRSPGAAAFRHQPVRTVATGVVLAVHWWALIAALLRAPIGIVLLVTYLGPVGVAVVAPRALGERLTARLVAALALALAGTALIASRSLGGGEAAGVALAAAAAALYVVLMVLSKPLSEAYGGPRLAFLELAVAGVVLLPVAVTAGWGAPTVDWAWLLVLGLVHTALAVGLFLAALARLPATQVGILTYLEPASAVLFGWWLLDEAVTPATIVGGALIVGAGLLVLRPSVASRPAPHPEVIGVPR